MRDLNVIYQSKRESLLHPIYYNLFLISLYFTFRIGCYFAIVENSIQRCSMEEDPDIPHHLVHQYCPALFRNSLGPQRLISVYLDDVMKLNIAEVWRSRVSFEFFRNSCLIRWIQQNQIYQKSVDLTRDWTQIKCLAVSHSNHYTITLFSVLVWGCYWILFMHGWFCWICLIFLIGRNSLHFENKLRGFALPS